MSDYKIFSEIDEHGMFIGTRSALNKDKSTGEWLLPLMCYDIEPPVIPVNMVAVINNTQTGWIFKDDNRGEWFNIDTREIVTIDYPTGSTPDNYIRQILTKYESYDKDTKSVQFNINMYKNDKIEELARKCNHERFQILSDEKIMNILTGATFGYPEYLTPANVSKLIEIYKDIYHTYASKINTAISKDEVDAVIKEIKYPTEQYILNMINN